MFTYSTNHHTVVDTLEGGDGLEDDKQYSENEKVDRITCAGTVEKCEKLRAYTVQIVMSSPGKETWAMKKILRRRMVRRAAMTGMSLLNLILSSKAPATPLDKQFIIPLTP